MFKTFPFRQTAPAERPAADVGKLNINNVPVDPAAAIFVVIDICPFPVEEAAFISMLSVDVLNALPFKSMGLNELFSLSAPLKSITCWTFPFTEHHTPNAPSFPPPADEFVV